VFFTLPITSFVIGFGYEGGSKYTMQNSGVNGHKKRGARALSPIPEELLKRPNPFESADVAQALEDGVEPPEVLVEDVILAGKVHSVYSAGGTGKTFYAAYIAGEVLKGGGSVVYFDQENGLRIIAERAECLGITPEMARGNLHYYPFPTMSLEEQLIEAFEDLLDEIKPDLVIFDSWVNLLAMCGLKENESVDVATWSEAYSQKARHRGIAVLILDHVPKDGKGPRGSGRKRDYVADRHRFHIFMED
jgi:hypothetical protein